MQRELLRHTLLGLTVAAAVAGMVGSLHTGRLPGNGSGWSIGLVAVGYGGLGWLVAGRRPQILIGWLLLAGGLAEALGFLADWWAVRALRAEPGSMPGGRLAAWATGMDAVPFLLVVVVPLVVFPDGRPRSQRWRRFLSWSASSSAGCSSPASC